MKRIFFSVVSLFLFAVLISCSGKKESDHAQMVADDDEWPMMDEFHMIMAESFHPYKDSANIGPAIEHAQEMADMADKWSNSALPSKVNTDEVKSDLQVLKAETAAFAELVRSGDEAEIGAALRDLHDLFHRLQDAWYHGGDGHKHHH